MTLLLGSTGLSAAEEKDSRWYQVDIVVFSNADSTKEHETWRSPGTSNDLSFAAERLYPGEIATLQDELAKNQPPLRYVEAIPPEQSTLKSEAEQLANSPDYHLLVNKSWIQTVDKNGEAIPVVIDDLLSNPQLINNNAQGEAMWELPVIIGSNTLPNATPSADAEEMLRQALVAEEELDEGIVIESEPSSDPVLDSIPVVRQGPPVQLVFGTIAIKWSRYLHLVVDVTYRRDPQRELAAIGDEQLQGLSFPSPQAETTPTVEAAVASTIEQHNLMPDVVDFRIADSRRLRRNQIYFFDHPLFGVLIKVSNYEPPSNAEKSEGAPRANSAGALGGR